MFRQSLVAERITITQKEKTSQLENKETNTLLKRHLVNKHQEENKTKAGKQDNKDNEEPTQASVKK